MNIHSISKKFRYYPTAKEVNYLISHIKEYFSHPERSPERNHIASSISNHLKKQNPHWTHRAVRLWLNNNKKNYLEPEIKEENVDSSKSILSPPKRHILSDPSVPLINQNSLLSSSSSQSHFLVPFSHFPILLQNSRNYTSFDSTLDKICSDINQMCTTYNINPLLYLPKHIPILSFPPFIKHQIDINNLVNSNHSQDTTFWASTSFSRSSSFPFDSLQHPFFSETPESHPQNPQLSNLNLSQQLHSLPKLCSSSLKFDVVSFLSSSHSLFINNYNVAYRPTFFHSSSESNSKTDWISCSLPKIINLPITSVFPISSNHFFITDSSQVYLIEIDSKSEKENISRILKQNTLYNNPDLRASNLNRKEFIEMNDNKLFITKENHQILIYDENLENSEILSLNLSMNDNMNNNEFSQYYSAFKMIHNGNSPKFLIGHGNNVIFRIYEHDGKINRHFVGHSHPIRDFLQFNDNIIASAEESCLLLWDYRDQVPFLAVDFNPLSLSSNINCVKSTFFQKNFPINQNNNNDIADNHDNIDSNSIGKEDSNNYGMGIGMALSDGRMRFLDLRKPQPIKGFSNVVGLINKFVCSNEESKMAFFCSMPISYWECDCS